MTTTATEAPKQTKNVSLIAKSLDSRNSTLLNEFPIERRALTQM